MQQEQFTKQFIGGEWLEGSSSKTIENTNAHRLAPFRKRSWKM